MAAAETNSRKTSIPFTAADNFVGPADFKVTVKSGFGDTDAEGNRLYSYTANGLKPAYENEFNRNGLANSDDPTTNMVEKSSLIVYKLTQSLPYQLTQLMNN